MSALTNHIWQTVRSHRIFLVALLAAVILTAVSCANQPEVSPASAPGGDNGSCSLDLDGSTSDEDAIRAVLTAEGESVVNQDIDALMRLWAESSIVSDAKNTPDDPSDDRNWDGRDAIRHRYVRTVFPGAPSTVQPSDLDIDIDGSNASVSATTRIGSEVSPAGDLWQLEKADGCWFIQSLTYNLEAE